MTWDDEPNGDPPEDFENRGILLVALLIAILFAWLVLRIGALILGIGG